MVSSYVITYVKPALFILYNYQLSITIPVAERGTTSKLHLNDFFYLQVRKYILPSHYIVYMLCQKYTLDPGELIQLYPSLGFQSNSHFLNKIICIKVKFWLDQVSFSSCWWSTFNTIKRSQTELRPNLTIFTISTLFFRSEPTFLTYDTLYVLNPRLVLLDIYTIYHHWCSS